MCLALPAQVLEREGDDGWVQLGETRMRANLIITPEAGVGDWVLVHAGFAIQQVSEEDARETFRIFESMAECKEGEA